MPGSDASQFTQFKKANSVQRNPKRPDKKLTTHLTNYTSQLSGAFASQKFLSSLTLKYTRPVTLLPINVDSFKKKHSLNQNCS